MSTRTNVTNLSISEGYWSLKVSGYDEIDYGQNSTEIIFAKDLTPSVITLIRPADGDLIRSDMVRYGYNVSDLTPIRNCSYETDGSTIPTLHVSVDRDTEQNFIAYFVKDGVYSWRVRCIDSTNNSAVSLTRTVAVEIPPRSLAPTVGAGGPITPKEQLVEYSVSETSLETSLKAGKADSKKITIRNTGATKMDVVLYPKNLGDYVFISEPKFSLEIGQERTVTISIIGKDIGTHTGELLILASGTRRAIPMIIAVSSDQMLFDVKMDIPSDFKEMRPGSELKAQITLFNIVGGEGEVNVDYIIKDMDGNVVSEESEVVRVKNQKSYVKTYKVPNLNPGDYAALVDVRYGASFATSSEMFNIKEARAPELAPTRATRYMLIYTLLSIIILFMIYIIVRFAFGRRKSRTNPKNTTNQKIYK